MYIHERNAHNVEGYAAWAPVFGDGYYWRVIVEVKWDPEHRVPAKHHDQIVVDTKGVHIAAILIEKRRLKDIPCGEMISKVWDPIGEANPLQPMEVEEKDEVRTAIEAAEEAVKEAVEEVVEEIKEEKEKE